MTLPVLRCVLEPAVPLGVTTPLLVLGPSLGTTTAVWQPTVDALTASGLDARILRFDLPGHGTSPATTEPFTMSDLADAVVRLVDERGGGRFHYAGISLGGAIGIELAVRYRERLLSLGLFATGAKIGTAESWAERAELVRDHGTGALVGASSRRWFSPGFLDREPATVSRTLDTLSDVDDESYALANIALGSFDRTADAPLIATPTAIMSGGLDATTSAASLALLALRIPGSTHDDIADSAHLVVLEAPVEAAALISRLVGQRS